MDGVTAGGMTAQQLASTGSYVAKNLSGVILSRNDLSGWDFTGQNLTGASLASSTLTGTIFSGANVSGVNFGETTSRGFTESQLKQTASYQSKQLAGIGMQGNDLLGWDLSGQSLVGANFSAARLTGADFSGADVRRAFFDVTADRGFTQQQLARPPASSRRTSRGSDCRGTI